MRGELCALLDRGDRIILVTHGTGSVIAYDVLWELSHDPRFVDSYGDGKVARVIDWAQRTGRALDETWFYSDSFTDLPLLGMVTHPFAVDPDDTLRQEALRQGWPIISLR